MRGEKGRKTGGKRRKGEKGRKKLIIPLLPSVLRI
jgi:hypothetical protein